MDWLSYHSLLFPFIVHLKMRLHLLGLEQIVCVSIFSETIRPSPMLLSHWWASWSWSVWGGKKSVLTVNILFNANKSWWYCTANFFFKINSICHIAQVENLLWPKVKQTVNYLKNVWLQNYSKQIFASNKEPFGFIVSLGSCTFKWPQDLTSWCQAAFDFYSLYSSVFHVSPKLLNACVLILLCKKVELKTVNSTVWYIKFIC